MNKKNTYIAVAVGLVVVFWAFWQNFTPTQGPATKPEVETPRALEDKNLAQ